MQGFLRFGPTMYTAYGRPVYSSSSNTLPSASPRRCLRNTAWYCNFLFFLERGADARVTFSFWTRDKWTHIKVRGVREVRWAPFPSSKEVEELQETSLRAFIATSTLSNKDRILQLIDAQLANDVQAEPAPSPTQTDEAESSHKGPGKIGKINKEALRSTDLSQKPSKPAAMDFLHLYRFVWGAFSG